MSRAHTQWGRGRGLLRGLALACMLLAVSAPARAGRLCGDDLSDLLYSNQFGFDPGGIPIVNIGLMSSQDKARFTADGGLLFWSDTEGGSTFTTPGSKVWTATVEEGRPAELRYWAVADRVVGSELREVAAALERWRGRGFADATPFELGAIFGFRGQVFDNRSSLVCVGGAATRAEAAALAERLHGEHGVPVAVHEEMRRPPGGRIVVSDQTGALRIQSPRVLMATPQLEGTFRVLRVEHGLGTRWHGFQDRTYRGALFLAVGRDGRLVVGNQVNAEELLAGLVPAEIFPDSPPAALRAQAVAARGIVLSKLGTRHLADPFLLCSQVHCQVYSGAQREQPACTKAVHDTRGEVLLGADGRLVDTVYHSSSGGHTADNDTVWPGLPDPRLRGRPDTASGAPIVAGPDAARTRAFLLAPPGDAYAATASRGRAHFRWEVEIPAARMDELVARQLPDVGRVLELQVARRGRSGRVQQLDVIGSGGRASVHWELPVRRLLGGLKSGLFVVDVARDGEGRPRRFTFHGGGFGHGVGMCQIGAIGRAEAGQDYRTILEHYYDGARVQRIY